MRIIAATNRNLDLKLRRGCFVKTLVSTECLPDYRTAPARPPRGRPSAGRAFRENVLQQAWESDHLGFSDNDEDPGSLLWPGNVRELANVIERRC